MDWFLYDNGLRHERVKYFLIYVTLKVFQFFLFMIEKYSGTDRDGLCSEERQNKSFMLLASTHPLKLAIDQVVHICLHQILFFKFFILLSYCGLLGPVQHPRMVILLFLLVTAFSCNRSHLLVFWNSYFKDGITTFHRWFLAKFLKFLDQLFYAILVELLLVIYLSS